MCAGRLAVLGVPGAAGEAGWRRVLAGLILLLAATGCERPDVSVYTPIDELPFADAALTACVKSFAEGHERMTAGRMETLHCSGAIGDKITSLEGVAALVNLTDLSLAHNRIRDVSPLLGLKKLVRLDLAFNDLDRIDALPWAHHVDLNHNRLQDLRFAATSPDIRTLLLEYNRLEDLRPLRDLDSLVELQVSNNWIERLDGVEGQQRLKYLGASNNQIAPLEPLAGLTELVGLQLAANDIDDVAPLQGLIELRTLDLSRNRISDVAPLAALANLKVLKLSDNPLRNVTALVELDELHELDVRGVPELTCAELSTLISAFSARVVVADRKCDVDPTDASQ